MGTRLLVSCIAVTVLATARPPVADAQIRASERAVVSQTIDGTTITIDYSRPQVRGREELFGGVIDWEHVWTPGANWATTIEVNNDITIENQALPAGKYSMWIELAPEEWTVVLDPTSRLFHLFAPQPSDAQVRFTVPVEEGPHTEALTFSFPVVRPTGGVLQLAWGTTVTTFDVGVPPSRDLTIAANFAERYVGSYVMHRGAMLGGGDVSFDIAYEGERLVARWESPPTPRFGEFWLVSLGEGMFAPGELEQGELFDIVMDVIFEFDPYEGTAETFEVRVLGDALWATGERN